MILRISYVVILFSIFTVVLPAIHSSNFNQLDNHPSYLALAPKVVRPGTIYKVLISILHSERPINIRTSISMNGVEFVSATDLIEPSQTNMLQMKVPQITIAGDYRLKIEGNVNGALGGTVFSANQELQFSPRFLTIIIQTNRAVYNADQTVRFRIIILTAEMKPYTETFDINIINPKGYVMKNYGSTYLNVGMGSFEYQMPLDPSRGWWTVQVVAKNQVEEKRIHVEKYYVPRTEVFMQMPEAVYDTDEAITGVANGWYLNSAPVYGNGTLKISVITPASHYKHSEPIVLREEEIRQFAGLHEFTIPLRDIEEVATPLPGCIVKAEFSLYDQRMEFSSSGFIKTRIVDGSAIVRFTEKGPMIFKPGMPFRTYVTVSHGDFSPLPKERIKNSNLRIARTVIDKNGRIIPMLDMSGKIDEDGMFKLDFSMPENIIKVTIKVIYEDPVEVASAEISAYPYYSTDNRRLHAYTTTKTPTAGEYLIIHVQGNFLMTSLNYVIVSKGLIIHSGTEEVENMVKPIKTFAISLSKEMVPSCTVIVYHITMDGILISDSFKVPVVFNPKNRFKFELNNRKDKTGNTLEYCFTATPGNNIAVSSQDVDTSCINCGHELSKATILENLHSFDEISQRPSKIVWSSRDFNPDKIDYFSSPNRGIDDRDTFEKSGLLLFTDAIVSSNSDLCGNASYQLPCLDGTCFLADFKCDKKRNCLNGYDETNCTYFVEEEFDINVFRIFRSNRFDQFYDMADGDWAWFDFNSNGFDAFHRTVPIRASSFIITAFETSREDGLNIIDLPLQYLGTKPFFITNEIPPFLRRGEQVGIRIEVFNFWKSEMFVLIVLKPSDDYKFVHVESGGFVNSYNPRTSGGEHHHLIWVQPGTSKPVFVPVVMLTVGEVTVNIEAWTHIGMDKAEMTVEVLPEGVTQYVHTSLMLDLKNQPLTLKFVDVNVTETPIVPYQRWRRYLFQSPLGHVSVVGDVFGPTFSDTPINAMTVLRMPDRTGEMQLFNFAANLWTLKYLRLTNQLTSNVAAKAFDELNYYYAYLMAYQHDRGYFTMFKDDIGSVWLTALVARTFHETNFPDWENDIYIDPQVIMDAVSWVLDWQTTEGSFMEPFRYTIDRKLNPRKFLYNYESTRQRNISLTAQVLLTLSEVSDLPGNLRTRVSNAKLHAMEYLDKHLPELVDPYEIAIVAYSLMKANSADKDLGFSMLDKIKFEKEGHVYWGIEPSDPVKIIMENQRPFIQPRFPGMYDAINVETTAYALLVYILKEDIVQEHIVRWLNTMRSTDGGFISTRDTIVAMEALTEYSFRARIRDITDIHVNVEASASPGLRHRIHITQDNMNNLQVLPLENIWGHITASADGSGFAILQLDVQYGVDYEFLIIPPPVKAFELEVSMKYSGKNSSRIHVRSCQRWTLLKESRVSGVAVVEIQTPSGYYIHQEELNYYVHLRVEPKLRRAKINHHFAAFYFQFLDDQETCIDFKFYRYYPVANMTMVLKARVYDYYAPELYNESMVEVMNLYGLDICQVCGSYQCPYCPYFNKGNIVFSYMPLLFIVFISVLFCK